MKVRCIDFYGNVHLVESSDLVDRLGAYGVYIDDSRVLLIQDPRSLRWELPGGGIEDNETIPQGLAREFHEETGLNIVGGTSLIAEWTELFFDAPTNQAWRAKREFYKIHRVTGGLLKEGNGDDSKAAKLIPIPELPGLNMSPKIRKVIALAI